MTPQGLREWATVIIRDIFTPGIGLVLSVLLPLTHNFQPWQLPLLAGMIGVPLVARGGVPGEQPVPPPPPQTTAAEDTGT